MSLKIDSYKPQDMETSWESVRSWHVATLSDHFVGLHRQGWPNLMATCFAILGAECCGALELVDSEKKARLVERLQERQDVETGLFDPGEIKRSELSSHSATYIRLQATYFTIHALNALGGRPEHPIKFRQKLENVDYLTGWLDGGNWKHPWMHSNNVMFALTYLQSDENFDLEQSSGALQAFDHILDYLDDRQDPRSGLWQPDDGREDRNAVFAAYHFFPYYYFRKRSLNYQPEIIDTLLTMIQPDGFFGYGVGQSGACEDLDVVHSLVMVGSSCDHRADEVKSMLKTTLDAHFQIQNSDGGFPNYLVVKPDMRSLRKPRSLVKYLIGRKQYWRYSGWQKLSCPRGESDSWGGWFRPLSIKLICDYLSNGESGLAGKYRAIPGLGWHFGR